MSQYQDKIDQWTDKVTNQSPYSSDYGDKIDKLLEQVWNRAKAMQESGMTEQEIMDYLDQFDENQLTEREYRGVSF